MTALKDRARVLELQRQVKIAREALEKIVHTGCRPEVVAANAL
jgi:hypothetical protein